MTCCSVAGCTAERRVTFRCRQTGRPVLQAGGRPLRRQDSDFTTRHGTIALATAPLCTHPSLRFSPACRLPKHYRRLLPPPRAPRQLTPSSFAAPNLADRMYCLRLPRRHFSPWVNCAVAWNGCLLGQTLWTSSGHTFQAWTGEGQTQHGTFTFDSLPLPHLRYASYSIAGKGRLRRGVCLRFQARCTHLSTAGNLSSGGSTPLVPCLLADRTILCGLSHSWTSLCCTPLGACLQPRCARTPCKLPCLPGYYWLRFAFHCGTQDTAFSSTAFAGLHISPQHGTLLLTSVLKKEDDAAAVSCLAGGVNSCFLARANLLLSRKAVLPTSACATALARQRHGRRISRCTKRGVCAANAHGALRARNTTTGLHRRTRAGWTRLLYSRRYLLAVMGDRDCVPPPLPAAPHTPLGDR